MSSNSNLQINNNIGSIAQKREQLQSQPDFNLGVPNSPASIKSKSSYVRALPSHGSSISMSTTTTSTASTTSASTTAAASIQNEIGKQLPKPVNKQTTQQQQQTTPRARASSETEFAKEANKIVNNNNNNNSKPTSTLTSIPVAISKTQPKLTINFTQPKPTPKTFQRPSNIY
eukprot:TRINITY_DN5282_c1_g1_i2.p1 TRINITY_DN5282_c1_g1~~TRINITY_DN5282_c1_g1_i2.p1  ORF type:complete len:173 (+),score=111.58 TRINITY_DN5282_c1_g1_i2:253-771(+)